RGVRGRRDARGGLRGTGRRLRAALWPDRRAAQQRGHRRWRRPAPARPRRGLGPHPRGEPQERDLPVQARPARDARAEGRRDHQRLVDRRDLRDARGRLQDLEGRDQRLHPDARARQCEVRHPRERDHARAHGDADGDRGSLRRARHRQGEADRAAQRRGAARRSHGHRVGRRVGGGLPRLRRGALHHRGDAARRRGTERAGRLTQLPKESDMKLDDMVLVSVDDHIVEPPTVFANHIPKKWAERAPRFVYDAQRRAQTWVWEGGVTATPFVCAVVTLPNDEWGYDPTTLAEMRPGCYDSAARVRDMDANGILASMCFPQFAGMGGSFFANCPDRELAFACLQAYNDWHIDEWAGSHPGRFIPLPLCALWSPELSAQEVRRVARKGATAIAFSEAPESFGHPSIHSGAWDPFFAACQEEDVAIAIHIASGNITMPNDAKTPLEVASTLPCWNSLACAANFLWCKSLVKYPNLKIALSEGGTSWIPGFLDRMERQFSL